MKFISTLTKSRYTVEQSEKSELFHVVEWDTNFFKVQTGNSLACFYTIEEAVDYINCCIHDDVWELQHSEVL